MPAYQRDVTTDDPAMTGDMSESGEIAVEHEDSDLLFTCDDALRFNRRWTDIQTRFVDDPRAAVGSADELLVDVMDHIGDRFAERRSALRQQWTDDNDPETEDLRLAMRRYRAMFQRLLSG